MKISAKRLKNVKSQKDQSQKSVKDHKIWRERITKEKSGNRFNTNIIKGLEDMRIDSDATREESSDEGKESFQKLV